MSKLYSITVSDDPEIRKLKQKMKDIIKNKVDDEEVKNYQIMEILKTNTEIKKRQKGEPFSDRERIRYETPNNLWRDSLAIQSNENIFREQRDAFVSNFYKFVDNNLEEDPDVLQSQVNEYIEQCKVYNENRDGKLKQLELMETKKENSSEKDSNPEGIREDNLLKCVRKHTKESENNSDEKRRRYMEKYNEEFNDQTLKVMKEDEIRRQRMEEQLARLNKKVREKEEERERQKQKANQKIIKPNSKKEDSKSSEDEDSDDSSIKNRDSLPISNRRLPKQESPGFFGRLFSFIPFTCAGRNDQDYYISDEDQKEQRKQRRNQKSNKKRKQRKN